MANNSSSANILKQALAEQMTQEDLLRSISMSLDEIVEHGVNVSQSSVNDLRNDATGAYRRNASNDSSSGSDKWAPNRRRSSNKGGRQVVDEFIDNLEGQFVQAVAGDPIKKSLQKSIAGLADQLGVSVDELGNEVARQLGQQAGEAFKGTKFGAQLSKEIEGMKDFGLNKAQDAISKLGSRLKPADIAKSGDNILDFTQAATKLGKGGLSTVVEASGEAAEAMTTMSTIAPEAAGAVSSLGTQAVAAASAFPVATVAVLGAVVAIEALSVAFGPAVEGVKEYTGAVVKASKANRELEKFALQKSIDRLTADINSMIEASYDVMKDAANKMLESWDSALTTVTATQGYTKADVQDLLSAYASRLQSEGLDSVVSTADLLDKLESVLQSGLSGQVAEEFAYIATVLNKAVPTEDFFQYASTYASIAANQIAAGMSQADALEYANTQLEQFASNLLYSSRELAGGFSTGLSNASSLFESANRIASASKTGEVSNISGVLTSVSAIVGALAPDLSSSIVDNIVNAALGGNGSTVTALRSLSGVGAGNTAFLKSLAENPQDVFSTLFSNLAKLQSMSNDNFMEVAEGLSETFGISAEAFARIDFNGLANAINAMQVSNTALDENMSLLLDGQTTSTAEQLRMQQINQYMLDQGLAYVLDNEVARSVQEHMWDEELAKQMQEATYGIEMTGATMKLMEGISQTIENIYMILHPIQAIKNKIDQIKLASEQSNALQDDLNALIEAGKVGDGNARAYANLTSRALESKNLTQSYLELIGGSSAYSALGSLSDVNARTNLFLGSTDISKKLYNSWVGSSATAVSGTGVSNGVTSRYNWGNIGKSMAGSGLSGEYNSGSAYAPLNMSAQTSMNNSVRDRLQRYLDSMQSYIDEGSTYDDWLADASTYGIADVDAALSNYGYTGDDAKAQFDALEAQAAAQYAYDRQQLEMEFYTEGLKYWKETWPEWDERFITYQEELATFHETLIGKVDEQIKELLTSNKQLKTFYDEWVDYYINHTLYSTETLRAFDAAAIRNAEKGETGDAVLALADALTSNSVDLKDPVVQTNVLLAQILKVAEAIMQQTNDTTTISLPTALTSLGLGVTSE